MIYYGETHIGNKRQSNEDCFFIPELQNGYFALVADGMGGHSAGEVASRLFMETACEILSAMRPEDVTTETLSGIFSLANSRIFAESTGEKRGMGTTATLAVFNGADVLIGHVGDSRAYMFCAGSLSQITHDHSYVQSLVDRGLISKEDAAAHPQRNIIMRAIGTEKDIETDFFNLKLHNNDVLLLCSDGLTGSVTDAKIAEILSGELSCAAKSLIDTALAGGGKDNITVVLAAVAGGAK